MRETSVAVVTQKSPDRHCLVVSLSTRDDTVVIQLQGQGGHPWHLGRKGEDVFPSEAEALEHLQQDADLPVTRGVAVLGYVPMGNRGLVLLATRTKTVVTLPGGHEVKLVVGSKWVDFFLEGSDIAGAPLPKVEAEKLQLLREFTLDNAHFYCETADITRPFPSLHPVQEPCREFVWNLWLGASLSTPDLPSVSPPLLQGLPASSNFTDSRGVRFSVALISRRSCLHPGMRYKARGLNALAGPGNEAEVDQIVWTPPAATQGATEWASFTWRRGTVPIWWGSEMKSGGFGDVDVSIKPDRPYRGTRQYFRRLQKRYAAPPEADASAASQNSDGQKSAPGQDASKRFRIVCVNLLKTYQQNELTLTHHFDQGVKHASGRGEPLPVEIRKFDWHLFLRQAREMQTAEELWISLSPFVTPLGMALGTLPASDGGEGGSNCPEWRQRQDGLLRYNCADSLDRTNAASYFIAVQVLVEQCRRVGVDPTGPPQAPAAPAAAAAAAAGGDPGGDGDRQLAAKRLQQAAGAAVAAVLPEGWEHRLEPSSGAHFYIDHGSKQTLWEDDLPPNMLEAVLAARQSVSDAEADRLTSLSSRKSQPGSGLDLDAASLQDSQTRHSLPTGANPAGTKASVGSSTTYGLFGHSVDEVRKLLNPQLVAEHASWFKMNGDMNAYLYTSSRAMHSEILNLLLPQVEGLASNAMGGINKLNNLSISVRRRWSNVLSDAQRQQTVELFLGLQLPKYVPSAKPLYRNPTVLQDESEDDEDAPAEQPPTAPSQPQGISPPRDDQAGDPARWRGGGSIAEGDEGDYQEGGEQVPLQLQSQQAALVDDGVAPAADAVRPPEDIDTTGGGREPSLLLPDSPVSPQEGRLRTLRSHPLSLI